MSLTDSDRVQALLERAGLGALPPRARAGALALAAIVIALAVWRFWPAAPAPEVAFDDAAPADAAVASSAQPAEAASPEVVVHVAGAVMRPGVYPLAAGSRVVDAVEAAGGALGSAALDNLNLARILSDGEQVYVLTSDEVAAGTSAGASPGGAGSVAGGSASGGGTLVNLNTATAEELDALPGVGPSTAQKIVADRESNGPFAVPEDLLRVPGIGEAKLEALKDLVTCQ